MIGETLSSGAATVWRKGPAVFQFFGRAPLLCSQRCQGVVGIKEKSDVIGLGCVPPGLVVNFHTGSQPLCFLSWLG